jgi:hypothetical protein
VHAKHYTESWTTGVAGFCFCDGLRCSSPRAHETLNITGRAASSAVANALHSCPPIQNTTVSTVSDTTLPCSPWSSLCHIPLLRWHIHDVWPLRPIVRLGS